MTVSILSWLGRILGHDRPLQPRLLSMEEWEAQHRRLDELEAAIKTIEDYDAVAHPPRGRPSHDPFQRD